VRLKMKVAVKQQVMELVQHPLTAAGFELADLVVSQYHNNVTLRVFVYGPNGVSIDDCARLSAMVGSELDRSGLFEDGYALEVSSPGLDRPLKTARDWKFRIGETVRVEFHDRSRKELTAVVRAAGDTAVELANEEGTFEVPLSEVKGARIVF